MDWPVAALEHLQQFGWIWASLFVITAILFSILVFYSLFWRHHHDENERNAPIVHGDVINNNHQHFINVCPSFGQLGTVFAFLFIVIGILIYFYVPYLQYNLAARGDLENVHGIVVLPFGNVHHHHGVVPPSVNPSKEDGRKTLYEVFGPQYRDVSPVIGDQLNEELKTARNLVSNNSYEKAMHANDTEKMFKIRDTVLVAIQKNVHTSDVDLQALALLESHTREHSMNAVMFLQISAHYYANTSRINASYAQHSACGIARCCEAISKHVLRLPNYLRLPILPIFDELQAMIPKLNKIDDETQIDRQTSCLFMSASFQYEMVKRESTWKKIIKMFEKLPQSTRAKYLVYCAVHYLLGDLYVRQGKYDAALKVLTDANILECFENCESDIDSNTRSDMSAKSSKLLFHATDKIPLID